MDHQEILHLAAQEGFQAALIDVEQVPVNPDFLRFCEENRCGQYGANYSCPPDCGTVEEMQTRLRCGGVALVLKSQWPIESYQDAAGIRDGKASHNRAMLRLKERLREAGFGALMLGGSCCSLCDPCRRSRGEPCENPELRFSCMSAYCVDVAELAARCGLSFAWDPQLLTPFGMLVLSKAQ